MLFSDEVFLVVARGGTPEHRKSHLSSSFFGLNENKTAVVEDDDKSSKSRMNLEKEGLFFRHLGALFKKRAANFKRDKKAWVCTTIIPSVFVLIGFVVYLLASRKRSLAPLTLQLEDYNIDVKQEPINPIPFNSPDQPYTCEPAQCMYLPVVSSPATDESYVYCGTLGSLNLGTLLNGNFSAAAYNCSIAESSSILAEIDNYQGAQPLPTDTSYVLAVSISKNDLLQFPFESTKFSCFSHP